MGTTKIPVFGLSPEIEAMLQEGGVYVAGDTAAPNKMTAIVSTGGKLYLMIPGVELDPMKLPQTLIVSGPFFPDMKLVEVEAPKVENGAG